MNVPPSRPKCGTMPGYAEHRKLKEPTCDLCRAANAARGREDRRIKGYSPSPRQLKPCGTPAAYYRHRNAGEVPCDACKQAYAVYLKDHRYPKSELSKETQRRSQQVWQNAARRLAVTFPAEYDRLRAEAAEERPNASESKKTQRAYSKLSAAFPKMFKKYQYEARQQLPPMTEDRD